MFILENDLMKLKKWEDDNIFACMTTNKGGVSTGNLSSFNLSFNVNDNPKNVHENRRIYAQKLNQPLDNFVFSHQTHSDQILEVTTNDRGKGIDSIESAIQVVDGLYTFENDVVISTFHADCTPIFFYSKTDNLIGVIHSGWQGTVKSIVNKAIKEITTKHNIDPQNISAAIGPSINYESFEIEFDVIEQINQMTYLDYKSVYKKVNDTKYLADIKELNRLQLLDAGLLEENIYVTNLNTYENDDFFSYRENNSTGRLCATIYQKN